jgi:hypothetical protein
MTKLKRVVLIIEEQRADKYKYRAIKQRRCSEHFTYDLAYVPSGLFIRATICVGSTSGLFIRVTICVGSSPSKMVQSCPTRQCPKAVTNTNSSPINHLPVVALLVSSMLPDTRHVPAAPSWWDHRTTYSRIAMCPSAI